MAELFVDQLRIVTKALVVGFVSGSGAAIVPFIEKIFHVPEAEKVAIIGLGREPSGSGLWGRVEASNGNEKKGNQEKGEKKRSLHSVELLSHRSRLTGIPQMAV